MPGVLRGSYGDGRFPTGEVPLYSSAAQELCATGVTRNTGHTPPQGPASGNKPHVGIAGVTLHKPRPISIIERHKQVGLVLEAQDHSREGLGYGFRI